MPLSGGNAVSCHEHTWGSPTDDKFNPLARLLLLRLSSRCLARDFLTGAVVAVCPSSSGSLCTSQREGDLKRRLGLCGEVTGEVSRCTRLPNMVIVQFRRSLTRPLTDLLAFRFHREFSRSLARACAHLWIQRTLGACLTRLSSRPASSCPLRSPQSVFPVQLVLCRVYVRICRCRGIGKGTRRREIYTGY